MTSHSKKVQLLCGFCNTTFSRVPSAVNKTNYCSRKCLNEYASVNSRRTRCLYCQKTIKHNKNTFCNVKCYEENKLAKRGKVTCQVCNKTVFRTPKDINKSGSGNLFCGQTCFGIWYSKKNKQPDTEKFEMKCVVCEKITLLSKHNKRNLQRKVCGSKCGGILRTKRHNFSTKCSYCRKLLTLNLSRKNRKNSYCDTKCSDKGHSILMSGAGNPRYIDGRDSSGYHSGWNTGFKDKIRRKFGNVCCMCGVHQDTQKTKLDVHHIDSDTRNPDINNLVPLCRWCHLSTVHGGSNECKERWSKELGVLAVMVNEFTTLT